MKKIILKITFMMVIIYSIVLNRRELKAVGEADKYEVKEIKADYGVSAAIRDNNVLYTWGNNYYGILGDGTTKNRWEMGEALIYDVKSVCIKGNSMYALKNDGTVWSWGGQKVIGNDQLGMLSTPKMIDGLPSINFIDNGFFSDVNGNILDYTNWKIYSGVKEPRAICGEYIVDKNGLLYKFGEEYKTPSLQSTLKGIIDLEYCNGVYIACLNDGKVYTWGSGYLGNGKKGTSETPVLLSISSKNIKKIAAGYNIMLALDASGHIWEWGKDNLGYNVFGTNKNEVLSPIRVESEICFTDIASGYEHMLAVDNDGNIYKWGYTRYGEYGNDRLEVLAKPEKLDNIKPNIDFEHAYELNNRGILYGISAPSQVRYFKFIPEQSAFYEFGTESTYDTYGYIYDENKNEISHNDDGNGKGASSNNRDFYIKCRLDKGKTYYVAVKMYNSNVTGTFKIYWRYYDDYVNAYNYDGIKSFEGDVKIDGKINYSGDVDVIKYVPQTDGLYAFESLSDIDMKGTLLDNRGKEIAVNDDKPCKCIGETENKFDYYIVQKLKAGKTYYLSTKGYSQMYTGPYSLQVKKIYDDYENEINDNVNVSFTLGKDFHRKSVTGQFSYYDDIDVIGIKVENEGIYNIRSTGIKNMVGTLYNSNGDILSYSDNSEIIEKGDNGFCIRYHLKADTIYYVEMKNIPHSCIRSMYALIVEIYDDYENGFENSCIVKDTEKIKCKLNYKGDIDVIAFKPAQDCVYSIESVTQDMDLKCELFDSNKNKMCGNNDSAGVTISGNVDDFCIEAKLFANRVYYIKIEDFRKYDIGNYEVRIRKLYKLEIDNYYDSSFIIRNENESSKLIIEHAIEDVSRMLKNDFNIKVISSEPVMYESLFDKCDKDRNNGIIDKNIINSECTHMENHTLYDADFDDFAYSTKNKSNRTRLFILWTGHTTYSYGDREQQNRSFCSVDNIYGTHYGISIQKKNYDDVSGTLAHEISHAIGGVGAQAYTPDHYHEMNNHNNSCFNYQFCSDCNPGNGREKFCLMYGDYTNFNKMIKGDTNEQKVYCNPCRWDILCHLNDHHLILD